MDPKVYVVGCVGCGPIEELTLDLESERDVAQLGLTVAKVLADDHTPIVMDKAIEEMAEEETRKAMAAAAYIPDLLQSNWRDVN